jgi:inner membrane protein
MNRGAHMIVGAAAGAGGYYLASKLFGFQPTWQGALTLGGAGALVACLPDILEPALHPRHRAFFHSVACNGGRALGLRHLARHRHLTPQQKIILMALGCSYLSHPLIDATTPMGLPLI